MFVTCATSLPTGILKKIKFSKYPQFVIFGQGPGENNILLMNFFFTNTYYSTCNFIMINNILGTDELNRKQSNVTQLKQHLPVNFKVKTRSNNQIQNIVKANFFIIKFEGTKSSISKQTYPLRKENSLCY
jgi:hypothetical protein